MPPFLPERAEPLYSFVRVHLRGGECVCAFLFGFVLLGDGSRNLSRGWKRSLWGGVFSENLNILIIIIIVILTLILILILTLTLNLVIICIFFALRRPLGDALGPARRVEDVLLKVLHALAERPHLGERLVLATELRLFSTFYILKRIVFVRSTNVIILYFIYLLILSAEKLLEVLGVVFRAFFVFRLRLFLLILLFSIILFNFYVLANPLRLPPKVQRLVAQRHQIQSRTHRSFRNRSNTTRLGNRRARRRALYGVVHQRRDDLVSRTVGKCVFSIRGNLLLSRTPRVNLLEFRLFLEYV